MAGSLHGSARTTPRVRAELQASQETTSTLAQRYGLSRTTVAKSGLALCDDGRRVVVDGANPWLHIKQPNRLNAEVIAFLGQDAIQGG